MTRTPRRTLSPAEREQRAELVCRLYSAGCTTREICLYVNISHGACLLILDAGNIPRRPRGRPRFSAPPSPHPWEILGEDYVPVWFTPTEVEQFEHRLQHLMLERKLAPGPTRVSEEYDMPHTVYREVDGEISLSLAEDDAAAELEEDERALPELPSALIADRLSAAHPDGGLSEELLEDPESASDADEESVMY